MNDRKSFRRSCVSTPAANIRYWPSRDRNVSLGVLVVLLGWGVWLAPTVCFANDPPTNTATDITFQGDQSAGINVVSPPAPPIVNVVNLTTNIAPATGVAGIEVRITDGSVSELNVDGAANLFTSGTNAHGIWVRSEGGFGGSFELATNIITFTTNTVIVTNAGNVIVTNYPVSTNITQYGNTGTYGQPFQTNISVVNGGTLTVNNHGAIHTAGGSASGILAESVYGGIVFHFMGIDWPFTYGNGGDVIVNNTGDITTSGVRSQGISARSLGGWNGFGGDVSVNSTGEISTTNNGAHGIFALSQGGYGSGGGDGFFGGGDNGNPGGNAGNVTVLGSGNIETFGHDASGILAISQAGIGGPGGDAGLGGSGGAGGAGGIAGWVTVDGDWNITTHGTNAQGIAAHSLGGSGGNGGDGGFFGGSGGTGGATGDGGRVALNSEGDITTWGMGSRGLFAQSIGGFAGGGGDTPIGIFYAAGGSGGSVGAGGLVNVTNRGSITTFGNFSDAIVAQSIGGGGGSGGSAGGLVALGGYGSAGGNGSNATVLNVGSIVTTGERARGILAQSIGGGGGDGAGSGGLVSLGGSGSGAGHGGLVVVTNSGSITTTGRLSVAIQAQSIGGGGGSGAGSGGLVSLGGDGTVGANGGAVMVGSAGDIFTGGDLARGIFAQSIGGGGGDGAGSGGLVSLGGGGSGGGNGGSVTLAISGSVTTLGDNSDAIYAQSVGGGGGSGAGSGGFVSLGGDGSGGGIGGLVTIANSASVFTAGTNSCGIFGQSIGGGGGSGAASGALWVSLGGSGSGGGSGGDVTIFNTGAITNLGEFSSSIFAQSVGGGGGRAGGSGALTVSLGGANSASGSGGSVAVTNSGGLLTLGEDASAIFAQSIGGGGGSGAGSGAFLVSLGGEGASGGNGGAVTVENTGGITTLSNRSHGILAESVGGGGGSGAGSGAWTVSIGGGGSVGGDGGQVWVTNAGNLMTYGNDASGIYAHSVGGGGGGGAGSGAFTVSIGGDGGGSGNGGAVTVFNTGSIVTMGSNAPTILAQSIGGGGGSAAQSGAAVFTLGGDGDSGGNGSNVTVTTSQHLESYGQDSSGIFAQSVGGKGGNGANVVNVSVQANIGVSIGIGGDGGYGGDGGAVTVNSASEVVTHSQNSQGIFAQSVGGGGGNGGNSFVLSATANVIEQIPFSANVAVSIGGDGGPGGDGGAVAVTSSDSVATFGSLSHGIFAQSLGGGGGSGGNSMTVSLTYNCDASANVAIGGDGGIAGNGAAVDVLNQGLIWTEGIFSSGIFAQSVGGGGGNGGNSTTISGDVSVMTSADDISPSFSFTMSMGGDGAAGGTGGAVNVNSLSNIFTKGAFSYGILAQSVGGGGGVGGDASKYSIELSNTPDSLAPALSLLSFSSEFVLGGDGGLGGNADKVTVNNAGNITTSNAFAVGILAQSVGGGGGAGGNVLTFEFSNGDLIENPVPYMDELSELTSFSMELVGGGGAGGNGANVTVTNQGDIRTYGAFAHGLMAQSVGGGGGFAGISEELDLATLLFGSGSQGEAVESAGSGVSFAGSLGGVGSGGNIAVVHDGNIATAGNDAHGIFAQSAGGALSGGTVSVIVDGTVLAGGTNADAIFAQSTGSAGGGNITVTVRDGLIRGGTGDGSAVRIADGAENTLDNHGAVLASSNVFGNAVIGGSRNETINNFGFLEGVVDLGAGVNAFNNYTGAVFNSGSRIDLGLGNQLINAGTLAIGGTFAPVSTALLGDYVQTNTGMLTIDLASGTASDQLMVTGHAQLDGGLALAGYNGFVPRKRDQWTVLSADQGLFGAFTSFHDPYKGNYAIQLDLFYTHTLVLGEATLESGAAVVQTIQDTFLQFAFTPNQLAVARNLDSFSGYNGGFEDPLGAALIEKLNAIHGTILPHTFDLIAPEELGAMFDASLGSAGAMVANVQRRSIENRSGQAGSRSSVSIFDPHQRLLASNGTLPDGLLMQKEPEAAPRIGDWTGFATGNGELIDVGSTLNAVGYDIQSAGLTLGLDKRVSDRVSVGVIAGYVNSKANLVDSGRVHLNGGKLGVFASWHEGGAWLDGLIAGGWNTYDTRRTGFEGIARGSTEGWEFQAMLGGGYEGKWGPFELGPVASLEYAQAGFDRFTETGSSAPLVIAAADSESLLSRLGARVAYPLTSGATKLNPELGVAWQHEFLDDTRDIDSRFASGAGSGFLVSSPAVGRDSVQATAAFGVQWTPKFGTHVYYLGQFARANFIAHNFGVGFSLNF